MDGECKDSDGVSYDEHHWVPWLCFGDEEDEHPYLCMRCNAKADECGVCGGPGCLDCNWLGFVEVNAKGAR